MTHAELVKNLVKPGEDINASLEAWDCMLIHMTLGISGESGELLDAIKKHVIYRKELDVQNIKEELGDMEFYMEGLRQALNISREEILEHNIEKLTKRYSAMKYSDEAAKFRADKK